jgi:hypothetical protein
MRPAVNSEANWNTAMFKRIFSAFSISALLAVLLVQIQASNAPVLAEEPKPECWAAIVGVAEYKCPLCIFDKEWNIYPVDVKHPADSARDLALQLSPIAGEDHIKLLLNSEATNASIYYAIQWLAEKAAANDTVLFYFCGHSAPQNLGSYDYLISDRELAQWLDKLHSQKVVVILDTCYAGSFGEELGRNGRVVLMSCQPNESSLEDRELKHPVFTHYILQALSDFDSADTNGNHELSAKEIFDYAKPKTIEEIVAPFANMPTISSGNLQHPTIYIPPDKFGEINLFMKVIFRTDAQSASNTTVLTVDGKSYLPTELPASFIWLSGSTHRFDIPLQVTTVAGTRLVFTSWNDGDNPASRTISRGGEYSATYKTQYKLTVESPYGSPKGDGWYDSGSRATVSIDSTEGNIIHHSFTGWSGDFTGREGTALVTIDKPKTVKANWLTYYLRLYLIIIGLIAAVGIAATVMILIHNKKKTL